MSEATVGTWVIDPANSHAEFSCKSMWGLMTVHGKFGAVAGSGTVGEDGTISGEVVIDAAGLNSKNPQRDGHLRSAHFFNVEKYPSVTVTVTAAAPSGADLACQGTISAGGGTAPVTFTAHVDSSDAASVELHGEVTMDRTLLGINGNTIGMVGKIATGTVTAKFVRA
jgi:polyisoprenoid-binding protein YceI